MSATLRDAMQAGQVWQAGTFPLEGSLAWSERVISEFLTAYAGDLWCETAGGLALADAAVVPTWPALYGTATTQSDNAERPAYETAGWDSLLPDGPDIIFDDVGTALVSPDIDFEGDTMFVCFLVCDRTTGQSGGNVRSAVEFGRYFGAVNGISLFCLQPTERFYVGAGIAGDYTDLYFDSLGSGQHVYGVTFNSALSHPNQFRVWIDGVERTPDGTGAGTGMSGAFGAGSLHIGARDDGAGGLERPFNGQIRSVAVAHDIPTDATMVMVSHALASRAGMDL